MVMSSMAALVAGLVTSIHCVGMCGPLACSVTSVSKTRQHAQLETVCYHVGRMVSYTIIGGAAGLLGLQPLNFFFSSPAALLPWMMIPFVFLMAFPNWLKIPRLKFLTLPYYRARAWASKKPPGIMGGLLGVISPCLPCTPLYTIFAASLVSGSFVTGATIALCFSLGTVPLLWLAQSSTRFLGVRLSPKWKVVLKVSVVFLVTVGLVFRLQGTIFSSGEGSLNTVDGYEELNVLPSCGCKGGRE